MARSRSVVVPRTGDPSVLTVDTVEVGEPGPGQLLVRLAAAGVNFIDVYQRQGIYPRPVPFVLGLEGAGVVEAVGAEVSGVGVGDRVAWSFSPGSMSELVLVPAADAVPVPEAVPLEIAAASMLQGVTAHYLVRSTHEVRPGQTILVHAAAGGVGQLLVQLGKHLGARVVATAGGPDKCALAAGLGADTVIDYRAVDDLAGAIRAATDGQGVDVAYDGVGKDTFEASLASLRRRGLLALYGAASGPVPPLDLQRLNAAGSVFVTRPSLPHHLATREELLWRSGELFDWIGQGQLTVAEPTRFGFDEAGAAYAALEGRRTTGKVLLVP